MINIAICDDSKVESSNVNAIVTHYFATRNKLFNIRNFDRAKQLWYEVEDKIHFDLYLLDIEMPGMDGIELADKIKKYQPDATVIFITSFEKYVYESFKVQPYRFVPKNRINEMLPNVLKDAIQHIDSLEGKLLIVENQQGVEKIPVKNILYIWHREKYAYIRKTDGEDGKVRKTLKAIYEELDQEMFAWIDKGCICNLSHIVKITDDCAYLSNGEQQVISRDRQKEIKKRLLKYTVKQEGLK